MHSLSPNIFLVCTYVVVIHILHILFTQREGSVDIMADFWTDVTTLLKNKFLTAAECMCNKSFILVVPSKLS